VQTLFEAMRQIRGDMGERDAALIHNADLIGWINTGARLAAEGSKCVERASVIQAQSSVPWYTLEDALPKFLGQVNNVYYRERPLSLVNVRLFDEVQRTSSSTPAGYYYENGRLGIHPTPTVTNYSTGLANFTKGSALVTLSGGASVSSAGAGYGWAIGRNAEPHRWDLIQSVDTTNNTVTLQDPWDEASVALSQYVLTDGAVRIQYAGAPDIALNWNLTGTATFTFGSPNLVGTGTTWSTTLKRGMWIARGSTSGSTVPTRWYRIKRVVDDTHLVLYEAYGEASASTGYVASDPLPLPFAYQDAALFYAKAFAFMRYGEKAEHKYWLEASKAKILDVMVQVARKKSPGEGHSMLEADRQDAHLWSGGGGW
jgi:hypothetical protein